MNDILHVTRPCRHCGYEVHGRSGFAEVALRAHEGRCATATREERDIFDAKGKWPRKARVRDACPDDPDGLHHVGCGCE